jgi:hypothetical protein
MIRKRESLTRACVCVCVCVCDVHFIGDIFHIIGTLENYYLDLPLCNMSVYSFVIVLSQRNF